MWSLTPRDADRLTLRATHRRIGWAPETIDLERRTDPLRHVVAEGSWPTGTVELASVLDALGIDPDLGRRAVRDQLVATGRKVNNEVLGAATRYRRSQAQTLPPDLLGDHP